jgi:2-oxoisovalerate dehydrogenase E2 component (dihydrolipoyl transacylase)
MADFLLPDLGEGLTDAEIVSWLVAVGDEVQIDQPVVEVETAKASVEVPVPFAGRVSAIFGLPGERVPVGSRLITIETTTLATPPRRAPESNVVANTSGPTSSAEHSGNVLIGYGTSSAPSRRRNRVTHRVTSGVSSTDTVAKSPQMNTGVISPVVRKLARDRGVDLRSVQPTDPSGVIRRSDVEAAIPAEAQMAATTAAGHGTAASERIPLTGLRRLVADKLSQSRREIPEATVWVDVDATALLEARRVLNAAQPQHQISVLALVARFCVLGLSRYRELNSRISSDAIEVLSAVNLGFAVQTDRGLMVPVVHDAQKLTTRELSAALRERTDAARAGAITPAHLTGGTFTVNNYGVFGVDGSAAIINYPEVAILGIGRIIDRPWVVGAEVAVRKVAELTLAFDHRACDGGAAGGFLRFVADCVENPITALGDL